MIKTDKKEDIETIKETIRNGKTVLGIELGSTRIKAVLLNDNNEPVAQGVHDWENRLENGYWTYSLEDIWSGLRHCYSDLALNIKNQYNEELTTIGAIGFSAMMHGYMPFDKEGELLVPFRTWRNTKQEKAAGKLTELFGFHIPQRWSIAHLYQAIINGEEHVARIDFFTTLAGYVHWKLTGKKVLGIGEASGMFPIDSRKLEFSKEMISKFNELIKEKSFSWKLDDILPKVMVAGECAGVLSEDGAKLLDETGKLKAGVPFCPPEGDAGTGMVATNAISARTGNVSAGTSVFSMVVLERPLNKAYDEIDVVTTPTGLDVAMVHCNNCTSDLNAWVNVFKETLESMGVEVDMNRLFETLYNKALEGEKDCGKLLAYNYFSGEDVTSVTEGRPLFVRMPDSNFNLANFMRVNLFTSLAALKIGNDILFNENVKLDRITGHGGLFKTKGVGQKIMAAALNVPVTVMETAGEGGAFGMALLAQYMVKRGADETLGEFLAHKVFDEQNGVTLPPDKEDVESFNDFIRRYIKGLDIEKTAIKFLQD